MRIRKLITVVILSLVVGLGASSLGTPLGAQTQPGDGTCSNTDCFGPSLCNYMGGMSCTLSQGSCSVSACS